MADDDLKVKKEKAYKFFLSQGKTPAQASAIVGNLLRESNLNPNAVGDGGKAFGLAQWHPDRQEKAKKLYGENWKSFENQLKFIEWELNNSEKIAGEALKKTNSVWEAGRIISDKYERPKTRFNVDEKRQQYVADIHKEFGKTQLTEEDKKMFETSYANSVAPYINQNIDFSNSAEGITFEEENPEKETEATQALKVLQEKQKEEDFLTELFSEQEQKIAELYKPIEEEQDSQPQSYDYNDISNFVESPILAQQGGEIDMYGNPIISDLKYDSSVNRTNYNPRTNQMIFGNDMPLFISQKEIDKTVAHENRHAWQFANDRTNFNMVHNPEYDFQDRLQKRPELMSTDTVFNNYHNRKQKETEIDIREFKQTNPQFSFVPNQMIYKKFVDPLQYNNPNSLEGEAQYYQETGQKSFQQGGVKIDNEGYWNPENWGHPVQINSNNITMQGVIEPLMGYAPETGEKKLMMPETNHIFNGANRVIETPLTEKEKQFLKEITKIK